MKKVFLNALLVLFVLGFALVACSDVSDETPYIEDVQEVRLDDVAFDTDQTPPDTGAVIR